MFDTIIDAFRARVLINRVVSQFGEDHRAGEGNSGCTYTVVKDGRLTPVCIVGQVFANMGLLGLLTYNPLDLAGPIGEEPNNLGSCLPEEVMWDRLEALSIKVTQEARVYFLNAQRAQDKGYSWGFARDYADYAHGAEPQVKAMNDLGVDSSVMSAEQWGRSMGLLTDDFQCSEVKFAGTEG